VSPRITTKVKQTPRVWGLSEPSIAAWLTDSVYLVRKARLSGSVDGTPNFTEQVLGPYAAKIGTPAMKTEDLDSDRYVTATAYQIAIKMTGGIAPREADRLRTTIDGDVVNFRIVETVEGRKQVWDGNYLYSLRVERTDEH
jgi:hypothetical protein